MRIIKLCSFDENSMNIYEQEIEQKMMHMRLKIIKFVLPTQTYITLHSQQKINVVVKTRVCGQVHKTFQK